MTDFIKLLKDCRYPIEHIHKGNHDESNLLKRIDEAINELEQWQTLPIDSVVGRSEQLPCGDCENYAEYDGGVKYCSVCGTKLS